MSMRVVITGGGTGGHIYPVLAIADRLCRRVDAKILYIGGHNSPEQRLAAEYGYDFFAVSSAGLHRKSPKLVKDLWINYQGAKQAKKRMAKFHPDLVIGSGGYVEAAVLQAARKLIIPTMIHEQNAYPGLANRHFARYASAVCMTFDAASNRFGRQDNLFLTGLPVRNDILVADKEKAYQFFSISEENKYKKTLLVTGGSQGAATLNKAICGAYKSLLDSGLRIIHLTGDRNYCSIVDNNDIIDDDLIVMPYLTHMEHALAIADLVVGRAGASFLAEITCIGLPSILVPYPYATNNHQVGNAKVLASAGAAIMIEDQCFNSDILTRTITDLFNDESVLKNMAAAATSLGEANAADKIVEIAINIVQGKEG